MKFAKPVLSAAGLVAFLKGRGLLVPDQAYAERCLNYIGYYRLKIYMRPFENNSKNFVNETKFNDIVEVYDFDRRLRLQCLDAIERIEVALRANIINIMGAHGGPHFYYDERYFENKNAVTTMRQLGTNGKHRSIEHYKSKYSDPHLPPIWCLTEASTFGQLSKIFADLSLPYRKEISSQFFLDEKICVSWFRSIATLRNICAHHNRLWNAELLVDMPKKAKAYSVDLDDNTRCYARLVVLRVLLKSTDPSGIQGWAPRLKEVIAQRPGLVELASMGVPEDWETRPLWAG